MSNACQTENPETLRDVEKEGFFMTEGGRTISAPKTTEPPAIPLEVLIGNDLAMSAKPLNLVAEEGLEPPTRGL